MSALQIEDFTRTHDAVPMTVTGSVYYTRNDGTAEIEVNTASILTKLIQEAGR